MIYFERVESTLKGGCNVQLGPKTVLCGANGSGKSTIVQSIELAANGHVSDMEGRARVKSHTALARLFGGGGDELGVLGSALQPRIAKAWLSDGTTFSWELEDGPKPGSFKRPDHRPPKAVRWPVQDLMEVLRGDPSTVAAWLEKQVLGPMTVNDLVAAMPPALREGVEKFAKRKGKTDFFALAKLAKSEARNLRTQATQKENTANRMVEGVATPLLEGQREAIQAELDQMSAPPPPGVTQAQYNAAEAELKQYRRKVEEKKAELSRLAPLSPEVHNAITKLSAAAELIKQHTLHFGQSDDCWVCGREEPGAIYKQATRLSEAMAVLGPQYEEAMKQQMVSLELAQMQSALEGKQKGFDKLVVSEPVDDTTRQVLLRKLATDDAVRRTWHNAEAANKEVAQLRAKADLLTMASKVLEKAGTDRLEKGKAAFEKKVSSFLPDGEEVRVDLASGRLGLVREATPNDLHTALSGAEWSRLLLALASSREDGSTPCVLVPEDRAWDRDTLERVMQSLSDSPVQVIIMSTVAPRPVEGWTCINL